MNLPLPKRLSGRKTRSDCPGHRKRDDGADRDPEHTAYMSWVTATVGEHGWAISGRHGDEAAPPWAYSVGMWVSCQTPELVLCGLSVENAAAIINAIGARLADGADYSPGDILVDICPAPLTLRPVESSWRATDGLLGISNAFYGMVRPPYLQVVWSDRNGRFPWEQGFQSAFDRMQPLLWLPRDDNPPSAWTRLDQLALGTRTSPATAREDQLDKKAQYAAAGIPLYLIVVLNEKYDVADISEFHLDAAAGVYRLYTVHRSVLDLEQPVRLSLPISDLEAP